MGFGSIDFGVEEPDWCRGEGGVGGLLDPGGSFSLLDVGVGGSGWSMSWEMERYSCSFFLISSLEPERKEYSHF